MTNYDYGWALGAKEAGWDIEDGRPYFIPPHWKDDSHAAQGYRQGYQAVALRELTADHVATARIAAEEDGAERDWRSWDAAIADHEGSYDDYADEDGPTCSICDGLGHGYPGGPPCPLERTDYSGEPWWAM